MSWWACEQSCWRGQSERQEPEERPGLIAEWFRGDPVRKGGRGARASRSATKRGVGGDPGGAGR